MPKHERGSYRSILTVLLDSPEFLALKPHARLMLFVVKMRLGPLGIAVVPGMLAALSESTGLTSVQTADALFELETDGWIRTQGNMIWLVNGLKYEPAYSANNMWHVKKIHEMLDTLPRIPLVQEYKNYYAEYLGLQKREEPEEEESPYEIDPPRLKKAVAAAKPPASPKQNTWVADGVAWWSENVGTIAFGRFGTGLKPLVERFGWERVFVALKMYVSEAKGDVRIEWFATNGVRYIEQKTRAADNGAANHQLAVQQNAVRQYRETLESIEGERWWENMKTLARQQKRSPVEVAYEHIPKA